MGILFGVCMTHHIRRAKCMQYGTASYLRTIVLHISEPFDMHLDFTCALSIRSFLLGLLLIIQMSVEMQASLFCQTKMTYFMLPEKPYLCPPSAVELTPSSSPTQA